MIKLDLYVINVSDVRVVIKNLKNDINRRMSKNSQLQNPYADINISDLMVFSEA